MFWIEILGGGVSIFWHICSHPCLLLHGTTSIPKGYGTTAKDKPLTLGILINCLVPHTVTGLCARQRIAIIKIRQCDALCGNDTGTLNDSSKWPTIKPFSVWGSEFKLRQYTSNSWAILTKRLLPPQWLSLEAMIHMHLKIASYPNGFKAIKYDSILAKSPTSPHT